MIDAPIIGEKFTCKKEMPAQVQNVALQYSYRQPRRSGLSLSAPET